MSRSSSSVHRLSDATRLGAAAPVGAAPMPASARLIAEANAKARIGRPPGGAVADHVLIARVESILGPHIGLDAPRHTPAELGGGEEIGAQPHRLGREHVEIHVAAHARPGDRRAPGETACLAMPPEARAVARAAHLADEQTARDLLLGGVEPGVAEEEVRRAREPELAARL